VLAHAFDEAGRQVRGLLADSPAEGSIVVAPELLGRAASPRSKDSIPMLFRKLALALGSAGVLVCAAFAEDLPMSGTNGFDFVCTTALDTDTGQMVSHFTVVNTKRNPPIFLQRLRLQALVANSLNRRFQAAALETAIAHDPTPNYDPPHHFGMFFVPTDEFTDADGVTWNGSISIIDHRLMTPVRTTVGLPNPCVYDVLVVPANQRVYCAYINAGGMLEVQAIDYSQSQPAKFGAPVTLDGPPSPFVTRLSVNAAGSLVFAAHRTGVNVLGVGGTPVIISNVGLPASDFVASNVDTNFQLIGNPSPWNICATDAPASATTGANVLVFSASGSTTFTLPAGFGAPNGVRLTLASGFNDPATISGWLDPFNPSYVLLRDTATPGLPGAVGVIGNAVSGGGLSMTLAAVPGEPFGNPSTDLTPNGIAFTSFVTGTDSLATLPRVPPYTVLSAPIQGFVQPFEQDMPVISQGGGAASVHTGFPTMAVGFETFGLFPPALVGTVPTVTPATSLPGAWRGSSVFPLTAVATGDVTTIVQSPLGGLPYLQLMFGTTGGRNCPPSAFPFTPVQAPPPYTVSLGAIFGPRRPAFNQSLSDGAIAVNVAFDGAGPVGGYSGGAMAVAYFAGGASNIFYPEPVPLVIGEIEYEQIVLSTEILAL
jgi:hypothetical protein